MYDDRYNRSLQDDIDDDMWLLYCAGGEEDKRRARKWFKFSTVIWIIRYTWPIWFGILFAYAGHYQK